MDDKKFVITIGRQFGSGGHDIGKLLAKKLGIRFYDKELLLKAAEGIGLNHELIQNTDEQLPSFYIGNLSLNLGFYTNPFATSPTATCYDNIQKAVCDTIRKVSQKESCVIVGRCADYLLRDNPRCINIFISASPDACARRIAKRTKGLSLEEAIDFAEKKDKQRADYYNFYTDKTWGHSSSYDLCIDSSRLDEEKIIDLITLYMTSRLK